MTPHLASGPRPVVGPGCCLDQTQGRGRRLHLLDLDNLHGSGNPSIRRIHQVRNDYDRLGLMDGDLVYGACMHEPGRWNREHVRRVAHICKVWPKGTVRPVTGKNGADKALVGKALEDVDQGRITWFDDVVIASGDHLFRVAANRMRRLGVTVHLVISSERALADDLRKAADGCILHLGERRCLRHPDVVVDYAKAA